MVGFSAGERRRGLGWDSAGHARMDDDDVCRSGGRTFARDRSTLGGVLVRAVLTTGRTFIVNEDVK